MMSKVFSIANDKDYHEMMIAIYELMNKGEAALNHDETKRLTAMAMAMAVEKYENEIFDPKLKKT